MTDPTKLTRMKSRPASNSARRRKPVAKRCRWCPSRCG